MKPKGHRSKATAPKVMCPVGTRKKVDSRHWMIGKKGHRSWKPFVMEQICCFVLITSCRQLGLTYSERPLGSLTCSPYERLWSCSALTFRCLRVRLENVQRELPRLSSDKIKASQTQSMACLFGLFITWTVYFMGKTGMLLFFVTFSSLLWHQILSLFWKLFLLELLLCPELFLKPGNFLETSILDHDAMFLVLSCCIDTWHLLKLKKFSLSLSLAILSPKFSWQTNPPLPVLHRQVRTFTMSKSQIWPSWQTT